MLLNLANFVAAKERYDMLADAATLLAKRAAESKACFFTITPKISLHCTGAITIEEDPDEVGLPAGKIVLDGQVNILIVKKPQNLRRPGACESMRRWILEASLIRYTLLAK